MEISDKNTKKILVLIGVIILLLCLCAIVVAASWFLIMRAGVSSLDSTATAVVDKQVSTLQAAQATQQMEATKAVQAQATVQASASATASARLQEIPNFALYETFDDNLNGWRVDVDENEYWAGTISVANGVYLWDVLQAKKGFIAWGDPDVSPEYADFDLAFSAKSLNSSYTSANCFGSAFRVQPKADGAGKYTFTICEDGSYSFFAYSAKEGWVALLDATPSEFIRPGEWNTVYISARAERFTFYINNQYVAESIDYRYPKGTVAVLIEIDEGFPTSIAFDNFALQER